MEIVRQWAQPVEHGEQRLWRSRLNDQSLAFLSHDGVMSGQLELPRNAHSLVSTIPKQLHMLLSDPRSVLLSTRYPIEDLPSATQSARISGIGLPQFPEPTRIEPSTLRAYWITSVGIMFCLLFAVIALVQARIVGGAVNCDPIGFLYASPVASCWA